MQYLKNNALLQCDKGAAPSVLNVTSNSKIKNRDGLFATHKDNVGGKNITSFAACAIAKICQLSSGLSLHWINTVPKVTVLGKKPLYEASKCICPIGGVISSINSGQI